MMRLGILINKKKLLILAGVVLILGLLFSLGRQVYEVLKISERITEETEKLTRLQQQNQELRKKLGYVESGEFIERQARDKLNLARENEVVMVISPKEIDQILQEGREKQVEKIPYWLGWLKVFWH